MHSEWMSERYSRMSVMVVQSKGRKPRVCMAASPWNRTAAARCQPDGKRANPLRSGQARYVQLYKCRTPKDNFSRFTLLRPAMENYENQQQKTLQRYSTAIEVESGRNLIGICSRLPYLRRGLSHGLVSGSHGWQPSLDANGQRPGICIKSVEYLKRLIGVT